jgi:ubiquinone/menaquinone biosynthesis C-methylase UbiE
MNRSLVNIIRYIFEEILPPILRDSIIFKYIVKFFYRGDKLHEELKQKSLYYTKKDFLNYYKKMPEINGKTDNSEACIKHIMSNILPTNVVDVGCGRGYLLERIRNQYPGLNIYGTEIFLNTLLKKRAKTSNFKVIKIDIQSIDKIKSAFDTVICTHVLEHVLDIRSVYIKLKKICNRRLIIVVPKERPYQYTFNGHLHFFPYDWSLINTLRPDKKSKYKITNIKRDFLYIEDIKK